MTPKKIIEEIKFIPGWKKAPRLRSLFPDPEKAIESLKLQPKEIRSDLKRRRVIGIRMNSPDPRRLVQKMNSSSLI